MTREATTLGPIAREVEPGGIAEFTRADRVVLRGISWELYETLREDETNWHVRMDYDGGSLELMSPSLRHEEIGVSFTVILFAITGALDVPCKGLASTTWNNLGLKKGKEADACFYPTSIDECRARKQSGEPIPPPDLAVEVEIPRGALETLTIYGALGVPEVWRFDGSTLHVHVIQPDLTYIEVEQSIALPFLRTDEVVSWLHRAAQLDNDPVLAREVGEWARVVLLPRLRGE